MQAASTSTSLPTNTLEVTLAIALTLLVAGAMALLAAMEVATLRRGR